MLVAVIGIIFATMLGFTIGIARLSSQLPRSRALATIYIETIRNIPLLLQLFFWYFAVLKAMPAVRDSLALPFDIFINQRGIFVPKPDAEPSSSSGSGSRLLVAIAAVDRHPRLGQAAARSNRQALPGLPRRRSPSSSFCRRSSGSSPARPSPSIRRCSTASTSAGGLDLPPEFVALVFGLTIYTAAFIAETVRGGIQAVSHGQTEAAQSLGLKEGDRLRLVIVPQAMRVIIPPLTSQYLNLTKNSSLGAAIGYPELVNVFARHRAQPDRPRHRVHRADHGWSISSSRCSPRRS